MPPHRRNPDRSGPPRRRPKIAGANRTRTGPAAPAGDESAPAPHRPSPPVSPSAGPAPADLGKAGAGTGPVPATAPDPDVPPADPRSRGSWKPVFVMGGAALLLGGFAVVAALRPGVPTDNVAWVDHAATGEVTAAATHAIEAMHGYNYETIDEQFAHVRDLLTEERRAEFDATADVTKQAAIQTHTVTEADVVHSGASMIDDSKAEVVAYVNVSATGDGIAQGSATAPILVRMEKTDGRWLVSEIRDR